MPPTFADYKRSRYHYDDGTLSEHHVRMTVAWRGIEIEIEGASLGGCDARSYEEAADYFMADYGALILTDDLSDWPAKVWDGVQRRRQHYDALTFDLIRTAITVGA